MGGCRGERVVGAVSCAGRLSAGAILARNCARLSLWYESLKVDCRASCCDAMEVERKEGQGCWLRLNGKSNATFLEIDRFDSDSARIEHR